MFPAPQTLLPRVLGDVGYTPIYNAIGTTAMSVPLTWSRDGLPIAASSRRDVSGPSGWRSANRFTPPREERLTRRRRRQEGLAAAACLRLSRR